MLLPARRASLLTAVTSAAEVRISMGVFEIPSAASDPYDLESFQKRDHKLL
jgi:hypothetical protein